jgi:drug/metabolite transporter (DMT)-like permease
VTVDHLLFVIMSLIWGATWISTKAGLLVVPPLFFGAMRYVLVAAVLLFVVRDLPRVFGGGRAPRIVLIGLLMIVATYGLIYWAMLYVASGVAGVVNMAMNPVCLFGFAILFGQEKPTWRHALALVLGTAGLLILFSAKLTLSGNTMELLGAAALVVASIAYCLGSVLARPLLGEITPLQLTAAQAVVGTAGLALLSWLLEPVSFATFRALMAPEPLAGLLFLVIGGTFIAATIFLRLVRDWGAPRAGLYSFLSPVVALALGTIIYAEPLTWREIVGSAILLVAAGIAILRPPAPVK